MIFPSLIFYYLNGHAQLSVLIISILGNHFFILMTIGSKDERRKKWLTALAISLNILALVYYKYATFLTKQFEIFQLFTQMFGAPEWNDHYNNYLLLYPWGYSGKIILLPLGISFFTFQQIAYILDLRAGRVKKHSFLDYIFCVTFFPHLIAGPIVNYGELIPQLKNKKILSARIVPILSGMGAFVIGLAKKIFIADTLAILANQIFDSPKDLHFTFLTAWIGALAYTFQIYFDFSGYSDMALGLARIFGLKLPINFASPYKAKSIIEFWQRWHITLSRFLREHLYIPLGGNRKGYFLRYRNLMLTMLIGGIWHGAGWTFLIWGFLHGFFLVVNHLWRASGFRLPAIPGQVLTFFVVIIAWVFFRASSAELAFKIIQAMLSFNISGIGSLVINWKHLLLVASALLAFFAPSTQQIMARYSIGIQPDNIPKFKRSLISWRITVPWLMLTAILAGVASFYETDFPKFLYWDF